MKCPFCYHENLKVTDSRDSTDMNAIRRRRECLNCLRRFTTFETVELIVQVKKRDGTYEDFQQQKLINGLEAACRHTKISHGQVIALASQITNELLQNQSKEITTKEIGEMVMDNLKKLDKIAYIRFACVYSRFQDLVELEEAIKRIRSKDEIEGEYHGVKENRCCPV
jgi:transcriptional repressor NrdR